MTNSALQQAAIDSLVVVDAGGTKTAAWLVDATRPESEQVRGRGRAGAGNPLSVGFAESASAIAAAMSQACESAGERGRRVSRAILSIAGAANERLHGQFVEWARKSHFADQIAIVSDVLPVLAAGSTDCFGVALISGTGSVAFGRAQDGRHCLRGGWGYLLGDEGSGYAIGRAALQHALLALEMTPPRRPLTDVVLQAFGVDKVLELTRAVYGNSHPRVAIAAVAPSVISLAEGGDAEAQAIIDAAANDLAKLVARTVQSIEPVEMPFALAISGGVLLSSQRLQEQLAIALRRSGLECDMNAVAEPLVGCIRLADPKHAGTLVTWHSAS